MFAYIPNGSDSNLLGEISGSFIAAESQKIIIMMKEVEKTRTIEVPILPTEGEEPTEEMKTESLEETYIDFEPTEEENPVVKDMIELEFDSSITNPYFDGEKIIQYVSKEETEKAMKDKIQMELIQAADPTKVDTHGVKGFDIDFCIIQRFFGGDRGKEIGFTQRMIYLQMKTRSPEEEIEMKTIFAGYEGKEQYKNFLKTINS